MEQKADFQSNKSTSDHILTSELLIENTRDHNKSPFSILLIHKKATTVLAILRPSVGDYDCDMIDKCKR